MFQSASETCEECVLCAQQLYELVVSLFHRSLLSAKMHVALRGTSFRKAFGPMAGAWCSCILRVLCI